MGMLSSAIIVEQKPIIIKALMKRLLRGVKEISVILVISEVKP